jgi:hypothetical protein
VYQDIIGPANLLRIHATGLNLGSAGPILVQDEQNLPL